MQPILWINPRSDCAFAEAADSLLPKDGATIELLERALRARYPNARVHARDISGEQDVTWYVYRDGHWVPSE